MDRLNRDFFTRDVLEVAPDLLGKAIVLKNKERYIITEVEAYRGEEDLACHASKGRTKRTEVMYWAGGHVYVYLIYGMYWMLNIVTGSVDDPQAVLIRGVKDCNGPGRVGKLLNIDKRLYGVDLTNDTGMYIEKGFPVQTKDFIQKERVGIDYAGEYWKNKKWRYLLSI